MNKSENVIALFTAPFEIAVSKKSLPHLEDEYVLVEYLYCGICGGDYSIYCGRRNPYPISLGHEFVGKILSVGEKVTNITPGQYVVSDFNFRCNTCLYCASYNSHLCIKNNIELFSNRGFAHYGTIHNNYLTPINPPDFLPRACLIEPLSCVIHACNYANIKDGMKVLVCGCGGIGMLFCFLLNRVFSNVDVTILEKNHSKAKKVCEQFNVTQYTKNGENDFDIIIDCSNDIQCLKFSLDIAHLGQKLCIMSHLYGLETSFVYETACKKELLCLFPLRNGPKGNLLLAAKYLEEYWDKDDDNLLIVYNDIKEAFSQKCHNDFCKQIIDSRKLFA